MSESTDRIVKKVHLRAPRERVWRAISDSKEFGTWFGVEFDGPFEAGKTLNGRIVKTKVDAEVAKMQEPYVGMSCEFAVERVEPLTHLSFRWHPGAEAPRGKDAPQTLVSFDLDDAPNAKGETLLTIVESGFDRVPLARRAKVFAENEHGWAAQAKLIAKYVEG